MVVRTGTNDQSHYLFKQGGKSVLSVQGLIIMFMFGVATTLTITAMWLFYTEYKLNQQKQRERISQDLLRKIFGKDKDAE